MEVNRDLTKLRRRLQGERQKSNRFNEQNSNSAPASRFLYLSLLSPKNYDVKLNDQISSLLENRNGEAMNSTICLNSGAVPSLQLQPKFPSSK